MRNYFIFLLLCLTGCVHAQQLGTDGAVATSGSIATDKGAVCLITTSSVPPGTQNVLYSPFTLTSSNCVPALTWSISFGSLPTGLSLNASTGVISGTPTGSGSSAFTVHVVDSLSHAAIFNTGLTIAIAPSGNAPAPPDSAFLSWCTTVACTPGPGSVITIGDTGGTTLCPTTCNFTSAQLSTAIASLSCGETLEMEHQPYTLPNGIVRFTQHCDQSHWITIERDMTDATFPPEGTRVDPCYAGIPQTAIWYLPYPTADSTPNTCARHMPLWLEQSATQFIFATSTLTDLGASSYRFIGIQIGRLNNFTLSNGLVSLNTNESLSGGATVCTAANVACMNHQPDHIIFDRMIFQGDAQREDTRGLQMSGGRDIAVLDSWFQDFKLSYAGGGGDANAWAGGFGKLITNVGRWKIHNNFFNASTEGQIQCGGWDEPLSASTGFDGTPHDLWESRSFYLKNPLMDTQIGQMQNAALTVDGQSYGPAPDQEFVQVPSAIELVPLQAYQVQTDTLNDSNAGINRSPAGTNTLTCGGGACGSVSTPFGNVGSGIHNSQNQFVSTYTAPASIPPAPVTYTRCFNTQDGRLAGIGHARAMCGSTVFTIVASVPVAQEQLVVGPQAPDLKIQPSYSDAAVCTPATPIACGNVRQFCLQFNAIPNFTTSGGITWSVDGINSGNTTVGTVDSLGLYCSPSTTGAHTIAAQTLDPGLNNISGSSSITVSNAAPIVAFDGRAFTSKNGWELKCGKNVLFENSLLEVAWGSNGNGGGQPGTVFLAQVLNQSSQTLDGNGVLVGYGPEITSDVTMRNLVAHHFGKGFSTVGHALYPGTLGLHRYTLSNFLFDDVNDQNWGHNWSTSFTTGNFSGDANSKVDDTGWTSATNPTTDNIFVTHGDILGHSNFAFSITNNLAQFPLINLTLQNDLWMANGSNTFTNPSGEANDCNTAGGTGSNNTETKGLSACWIPHTLDHMAFLDSTASTSNFLNPTLIWPIAATSVGFVNYNGGSGGDYRLCTGVNTPAAPCAGPSIFAAGQAHQASDGTNMGPDVPSLTTVETNVRTGVRTP